MVFESQLFKIRILAELFIECSFANSLNFNNKLYIFLYLPAFVEKNVFRGKGYAHFSFSGIRSNCGENLILKSWVSKRNRE